MVQRAPSAGSKAALSDLLSLESAQLRLADKNLETSGEDRIKCSPHFYFETGWLEIEDFIPVVIARWELVIASSGFQRGHMDLWITVIEAEWANRYALENPVVSILREEEEYWRPMGGVKWVTKGNANTGYFHAYANGRKRKCSIVRLQADHGLLKGFESGFVHRIMHLVSGGQTAVSTNGEVGNFFDNKLGLRQGDTSSTLILNLVVDTLSAMIDQVKGAGHIRGVVINLILGGVTHLQYADDAMLLFETDDHCIASIKLVLLAFEVISGLKDHIP
ncbi:Hydroxyisourate hydrolase [Hordeum vulgare]|nr:Hydroxyisourate hydrolase [Hordeum vulgare]